MRLSFVGVGFGLIAQRTFTSNTTSNEPNKSVYKMVALDMDGTLLGSNHELSVGSLKILRELSQNGVIITLATGRSGPALYRFVKQLDLPHPLPTVCYNGASCRIFPPHPSDPAADQRLLFETPLSIDAVQDVLMLAKHLNCMAQIYVGDHIFVVCKSSSDEEFANRYRKLTGATHTFLDTYENIVQTYGLPSKILLMTDDIDKVEKAAHELQSLKETSFNVIRGTPPFFVEFLDMNTCKGKSLLKLCDELKISEKACISFGDGDNDIEMLKYSGCGVAMCNAKPHIKENADIVTTHPNTQDGVARELINLNKNGRLQSAQSEQLLRNLLK